ncbi:hypothetical protein FOZ62_011957, partial [Perkinsus olseni]
MSMETPSRKRAQVFRAIRASKAQREFLMNWLQIRTLEEDTLASYHFQLSELPEIDRHTEQLELNMKPTGSVLQAQKPSKEYHAKSTTSRAILEDGILRYKVAGAYRD